MPEGGEKIRCKRQKSAVTPKACGSIATTKRYGRMRPSHVPVGPTSNPPHEPQNRSSHTRRTKCPPHTLCCLLATENFSHVLMPPDVPETFVMFCCLLMCLKRLSSPHDGLVAASNENCGEKGGPRSGGPNLAAVRVLGRRPVPPPFLSAVDRHGLLAAVLAGKDQVLRTTGILVYFSVHRRCCFRLHEVR